MWKSHLTHSVILLYASSSTDTSRFRPDSCSRPRDIISDPVYRCTIMFPVRLLYHPIPVIYTFLISRNSSLFLALRRLRFTFDTFSLAARNNPKPHRRHPPHSVGSVVRALSKHRGLAILLTHQPQYLSSGSPRVSMGA